MLRKLAPGHRLRRLLGAASALTAAVSTSAVGPAEAATTTVGSAGGVVRGGFDGRSLRAHRPATCGTGVLTRRCCEAVT
jgi:hypothetical protein